MENQKVQQELFDRLSVWNGYEHEPIEVEGYGNEGIQVKGNMDSFVLSQIVKEFKGHFISEGKLVIYDKITD